VELESPKVIVAELEAVTEVLSDFEDSLRFPESSAMTGYGLNRIHDLSKFASLIAFAALLALCTDCSDAKQHGGSPGPAIAAARRSGLRVCLFDEWCPVPIIFVIREELDQSMIRLEKIHQKTTNDSMFCGMSCVPSAKTKTPGWRKTQERSHVTRT
jgi:hypothetical protein